MQACAESGVSPPATSLRSWTAAGLTTGKREAVLAMRNIAPEDSHALGKEVIRCPPEMGAGGHRTTERKTWLRIRVPLQTVAGFPIWNGSFLFRETRMFKHGLLFRRTGRLSRAARTLPVGPPPFFPSLENTFQPLINMFGFFGFHFGKTLFFLLDICVKLLFQNATDLGFVFFRI